MDKGFFVVLEGVDRCGKTSQAELLVERLLARGISARRFSTPDYGGFAGRAIEEHLVGVRAGDYLALECLQLANRYEVASRIEETLKRGEVAVCVRWSQSAELYGEVSGQDVAAIRRACSFLPVPDLNILVDANPEEIAVRYDKRNTYEQDLALQVQLSRNYRSMWGARADATGRWRVVDGWRDPHVVAAEIAWIFEGLSRLAVFGS